MKLNKLLKPILASAIIGLSSSVVAGDYPTYEGFNSEAKAMQSYSGLPGKGKKIALWGLSFKPKTDDMREASSRDLMEALWEKGAKVQAFDPEAMEECQRIYGTRDDLSLLGTKEAALKSADALVVATEWKSFWAPDFDFIGEQITNKVSNRLVHLIPS